MSADSARRSAPDRRDGPGLPGRVEYLLPTEAPASHARWRLDPDRAVLLVHDMQAYFVRIYPDGSPLLDGLVANIRTLRRRCDELGVPVFYTAQQPHADVRDRGLQADVWGPGMRASAEDTDLLAALAPAEGHEVLRKWRYSAFQRSPLEPMMRARGRDQLVVTGIYANIGCLLTAADAFMRDIQPFFPADATADFSLARHLAAVDYVGQHCGQTLLTSDLLQAL